jgi:microcystin-dependent protein
MPSTYTSNLGIELPADGEQDGVWGDVVNDNMNILDRGINGSISLSLSGTSSTLTTSDGVLSNGQYKALILGGTPSGTHTITIAPNDAQKIYYVYNLSGQSVVLSQGSGTTVTIANNDTAVVYSDGGGGAAGVVNLTDHFAMNSAKITGGAISGVSLSTSSATVTGGTINGTTVGASTASSGAFTTLSASGATALSGTTTLTAQLGLGGANYGTAGQVLTSQGAGSAPAWANSFPSGGIILWSGSVASIPAGWLLCNGSSGTPDLRDRFVVGAGSTYAVAATGGSATVTLSTSEIPSHTHTFSATTSTDGAHAHTYQLPDLISNGERDNNPQFGDTTSTATTSTAGAHNHTVSGTTAASGSGGAHENRPPYYALAYIMKS